MGTSGLAGQLYYVYDTKRWTFVSQAEHYDRDFRMDTAFINRVGITSAWGTQERILVCITPRGLR